MNEAAMNDRRLFKFRGIMTFGKSIGVIFPELPGCVSQGKTFPHAIKGGREVLKLHLEGMLEDGDAIPETSQLDDPLPDWLDEAMREEKRYAYRQMMFEVWVPCSVS